MRTFKEKMNLKHWYLKQFITSKEIYNYLGLNYSTYYKYLRGDLTPNFDNGTKLLKDMSKMIRLVNNK